MMTAQDHSAFETFLVEDVILTLANLRGTLAWVVKTETGACSSHQGAWLERIDRQIETLEDRARQVFGQMQIGTADRDVRSDGSVGAAANQLAAILDDAGAGANISASASRPVFRSRRAAVP